MKQNTLLMLCIINYFASGTWLPLTPFLLALHPFLLSIHRSPPCRAQHKEGPSHIFFFIPIFFLFVFPLTPVSSILLAIWQAIPVESYELAYILRSFVFLWAITITLLSIFVQKIYFTIRGKKDPTKGVSGLATKGSVVTAYTTTTPSSLDGTSTPTVNYKTPAQSSTVN